MALRPEIRGFDMQRMLSLLGSKDERLLDELTRLFDEMVRFDDERLREESLAVLRRAVYEGGRWSDLDEEGEVHVMAAIVLAHHGQQMVTTESNRWTMPAFWKYIEAVHEYVPEGVARNSLLRFGVGRPLFGRRISVEWSYYGFLRLAEVGELLEALRRLPDGVVPEPGREFHVSLLGWLETIQQADRDLWFHCH
ncbi:MAG: hypothetical protein GXP27_14750 [Planctomycetes bacterium]|nr:hypothetical protein [Planctomycetota bacterium]